MGCCCPHLSLEERRKIAKWREAKMPVPEIADRLGRAPSTVYRELKRNFFRDKELQELNGYHAIAAQNMYERRRAIHRKMIVHPDLKAAIEDRLKAGWPPDQSCPLRRHWFEPNERVSRYTVVMRNEDRHSKPIMEALINGLAPLPADARQSITFDRGTGFSAWQRLKDGIGADSWFCAPQAPWQKGTVENTNNRLRKYLPRSTEPAALTNRYLKSI